MPTNDLPVPAPPLITVVPALPSFNVSIKARNVCFITSFCS